MNEEIQMFHNLNETLIVHWMNYERTDSNENLSYRSFWKIQQYEKDESTFFLQFNVSKWILNEPDQ